MPYYSSLSANKLEHTSLVCQLARTFAKSQSNVTFLKDIQCLQTNHVLASCQQARTEELCSSLFANELEYYGVQTQTETESESETEQTEMHLKMDVRECK